MSGGIYDGHRGGYSSNFDTFSTWKNNTKGLYNEYHIDGSWMDDGDYDKAFKGYPSKKTVNIFMGGVYQEPSWKTTLISGGIGLGLTALGMWAMGLFGGKKAKPEQPSTALNLGLPTSGYWNSYFSNWQLPSLFGNQTPTNPPAANNNNNNNNQTVQNTSAADPVDNSTPATTKAAGTAFNKKLNTEKVHGKITNIGNNNEYGYPTTFTITDTTYSNNDKAKGNVYIYDFVQLDDKKNPMYKLRSISYNAPHDKTNDISLNTYSVTSGITKGEKDKQGTVSENLIMETYAEAPAMRKPEETSKGDTRYTFPPKN